MAFFDASCTCWQMVLNEYGAIISTLIALATFAGLFGLAYILHKTLSPRTPPAPGKQLTQHQRSKPVLPNKKKKRKGAGSRNRTNKTRLSKTSCEDSDTVSTDVSTDCETVERTEDPLPPEKVLPAVHEDIPVSLTPPRVPSTPQLSAKEMGGPDSLPQVSSQQQTSTAPIIRERMLSSSTVESFAPSVVSCDQSCDSISGRSTPTQNVFQYPNEPKNIKKTPSSRNQTPRFSANNSASRKNTRRRSGRKPESRSTPTSKSNSPTPPTSSRWDALKPTNRPDYRRGQVLQSPPRITSTARENTGVRSGSSPEETSTSSRSSTFAYGAPLIPVENAPASLSLPIASLPRTGTIFPSTQGPPVKPHFPSTASTGTPVRPYSYPENPSTPNTATSLPTYSSPPAFSYDSWNSPSVPPPPGFSPSLTSPSHQYRVKANPFASDEEDQMAHRDDEIEAELQELGGQMIGSILDF